MKFLLQLSAVTQIAVLVHALGITILPPGGIDIAKDTAEYKACKAANPDTVYGVIRYESGFTKFLEYNDCAPFLKDGARVTNAVFCQPVTCYPCSSDDCSNPTLPVPFPAPLNVLNAADFAQMLGKSAYCSRNTLPRVR